MDKFEFLKQYRDNIELISVNDINSYISEEWRSVFNEKIQHNRIQNTINIWKKHCEKELRNTISYLSENLIDVSLVKTSYGISENLDLKDKYTVFLGGNDPLTVIECSRTEGQKLLLIKDSYANCEIPYLCAHFSEIHVVDLRYYKESISAYIEANGIDVAVVSYSVANFSEDTNIYFLTK